MGFKDPGDKMDYWLAHVYHLSRGIRYQRSCDVCSLNSEAPVPDRAVKDDALFYREANASGKKKIDF